MSNLAAEILNGYLPHLLRVDQAPSLDGLEKRAEEEKRPLESIIEDESYRRYKAMDGAGNIFEVQNPALMSWQCSMGAKVICRLPPKSVALHTPRRKSKGAKRDPFSDNRELSFGESGGAYDRAA